MAKHAVQKASVALRQGFLVALALLGVTNRETISGGGGAFFFAATSVDRARRSFFPLGYDPRAAPASAAPAESKDCGRNNEMRPMRLVVSASFYWDSPP